MASEKVLAFVENVKELTDIIKKENEGLPLILFGHSMGSLLLLLLQLLRRKLNLTLSSKTLALAKWALSKSLKRSLVSA